MSGKRWAQKLSPAVDTLMELTASGRESPVVNSPDPHRMTQKLSPEEKDYLEHRPCLEMNPSNRSTAQMDCNSLILCLPEAVLVHILCFIVNVEVDMETFLATQMLCRRFRDLSNSLILWKHSAHVLPNGSFNLDAFKFIKEKCRGTEGTCYHGISRINRQDYAIKRARVYKDNEGVPYYMMRELAALKKITNKHICELLLINLNDFKLHLIFPYVERTLHDYMNPHGGSLSGQPLKKTQVRSLTYQLLDAVSYCHKRGIVHRNLKPKHLLIIPGNGDDPLDNAQLKLADFALVRIIGHPPTKFTSEVITLWYRPPEILMGQKNYNASVDVWSIGCIVAEMMEGKPLFMGLCEIDQLFQIFFKMGTPNQDEWPSFNALPNFQPQLFPQWTENRLHGLMKHADEEQYSLLLTLLRFDPARRSSASEALHHRYMKDMAELDLTESSTSCSLLDAEQSSTCLVASHSSSNSRSSSLLIDPEGTMFYHPDLVQLNKVTLHQNHFLRVLESDMLAIPVDHRMDTYDRASVADKLLHTLDGFEGQISQRTVFFAVALMDRYYGTLPLGIRRSVNVYLLGATCLHIASKCEDVTYIGIRDLVNQGIGANGGDGGEYTGNDILGLEETILNALNFDLYVPTTIDFVNIYTDCIREVASRRDVVLFSKFIAESTLLSSETLDFLPSLLSAAAVAYSLHCAKVPQIWTDTLRTLTQYDIETLKPCMKFMHKLHERSPMSPFKTVAERYKRAAFLNVASWQPVTI